MAGRLAPLAAIQPVEPAGPAARPSRRLAFLKDTAVQSLGAAPVAEPSPLPSGLAARPFVPQIIIERDILGLPDWLAEFRFISVVYARLATPTCRTNLQLTNCGRALIVAGVANAMGVEIFDVLADEKGVIAKIAVTAAVRCGRQCDPGGRNRAADLERTDEAKGAGCGWRRNRAIFSPATSATLLAASTC